MSVFKNPKGIALTMLFLILFQGVFPQTFVKDRPNVIVIMTDDQGCIDLNSWPKRG